MKTCLEFALKCFNQNKIFFFKFRKDKLGKMLMVVETGYLYFENFRQSSKKIFLKAMKLLQMISLWWGRKKIVNFAL